MTVRKCSLPPITPTSTGSVPPAALELASDCGVPLRVGRVALDELAGAIERGWAERDCRVAMTLQEERAGISVRVPPDEIAAALD